MPKLTKRFVDQLTVGEKDRIVFDSDVPGFGIRVMPSGRKSYVIQYRAGGRTRRMVIGSHNVLTAEEARSEARTRLAAVAKGADPAEAKALERRAPTISDLCERFLEEHVKVHCKPRTYETYEITVRLHIRPRLGSFKIADVRRKDVAELHHALRDTPYQANRVVATLHKAFNLAELWGLRDEGTNPCRLVPKFKEKPKERFLSFAELERLGETFGDALETGSESPFTIAAYQLLLLTGCRLREIQTLRWEYVTAFHLELPDSKTGARRIPLSGDARAVLDSLPRAPGNPYVIEGKLPNSHVTDLQNPWQRLRKAAGLEDVRIHDLRHTYASMAVMNGIDLLTVGKILGHSNYQTTQRYAHLADEAVQRAAGAVASKMANALRRPAKPPVALKLVR
ncbi:MAG: tyrosine-type recombinase/integrase [Rhodobacteraceae bacterium]|nr:tyrosine-type recombinase/integrase [Paracoccaceae bacterium]